MIIIMMYQWRYKNILKGNKMDCFITFCNNGKSFDDYEDWIAGVFSNIDEAVKRGFENGRDFVVQEWKFGAQEKTQEFEFHCINGKWFKEF
jgi:hypothetical protein